MKKIHLVKDNSLWFYKRHEPLVKETSNPDRGRNKEIGTFLFIIIKHTAFYIQMHWTSFLKEKQFVSLI